MRKAIHFLIAGFLAIALFVTVGGHYFSAEKQHQGYSVEMVYLNDHQVIEIPRNKAEYCISKNEKLTGYSPVVEAVANSPPVSSNLINRIRADS